MVIAASSPAVAVAVAVVITDVDVAVAVAAAAVAMSFASPARARCGRRLGSQVGELGDAVHVELGFHVRREAHHEPQVRHELQPVRQRQRRHRRTTPPPLLPPVSVGEGRQQHGEEGEAGEDGGGDEAQPLEEPLVKGELENKV